MAKRICSIEGCARPHAAQGLCSMHYQRGKAQGWVSSLPREKSPCSVKDCDRDAMSSQEWCSKHWRLVKRYGKPESPNRRPQPDRDWLASIGVPPGARAVPVLVSPAGGIHVRVG